jgi:hydroxybutyrate-dimer hydrolase
VEVIHGNHFDIFSTVAPAAIVPLNLYFHRALDAMYAHLKDGSALPASQLVRTTPRFVPFVPLGSVNVPPIGAEAGEGDAIVVRPGRVEVPD